MQRKKFTKDKDMLDMIMKFLLQKKQYNEKKLKKNQLFLPWWKEALNRTNNNTIYLF